MNKNVDKGEHISGFPPHSNFPPDGLSFFPSFLLPGCFVILFSHFSKPGGIYFQGDRYGILLRVLKVEVPGI
jgi:hypothetical protein